jgi:hypothetical protein
MIQRPPFPEVVDSSMLSDFVTCPTKFKRTYLEHWKTPGRNVHLHAGGMFAAALEAARVAFYQDKLSREDAEAAGLRYLLTQWGDYEAPADSPKSLLGMCGALEYYYEAFPFDRDPAVPIFGASGKRGIEFSFVLPLEIHHPETGLPLLFSGRADLIAHFQDAIYLFDEKTTSSLGSQWAKQWELRSQFSAYTWAARQLGIDVSGVVVRGIAIRKTGYDHAQHIAYRAEWELERWLHEITKRLHSMIAQWHSGDWDYNLDHACGDYGGCVFQQVCRSPTPLPWLETNFIRMKWDPVSRVEVAL